jgi:hypothetical protein
MNRPTPAPSDTSAPRTPTMRKATLPSQAIISMLVMIPLKKKQFAHQALTVQAPQALGLAAHLALTRFTTVLQISRPETSAPWLASLTMQVLHALQVAIAQRLLMTTPFRATQVLSVRGRLTKTRTIVLTAQQQISASRDLPLLQVSALMAPTAQPGQFSLMNTAVLLDKHHQTPEMRHLALIAQLALGVERE